MPRPTNYISRMKRYIDTTEGGVAEKYMLLEGIRRYQIGEIKVMELSQLLLRYQKTVGDVPAEQGTLKAAIDELEVWASDD